MKLKNLKAQNKKQKMNESCEKTDPSEEKLEDEQEESMDGAIILSPEQKTVSDKRKFANIRSNVCLNISENYSKANQNVLIGRNQLAAGAG